MMNSKVDSCCCLLLSEKRTFQLFHTMVVELMCSAKDGGVIEIEESSSNAR